MKYESEGLFIGLVSFPYYVDGKELYDNVFRGFFKDYHRKRYLEALSYKTLDERLYSPTAYRMFGNYGLAILSLIDDYAFCSRIFNAGHIKTPEKYEHLNKYKSVVLAGSSECDTPKERCLTTVAENTFLSSGDGRSLRYPFIGIIRIKLDYRLLKNAGADITRSIKRRIESLKTELEDKQRANRKEDVLFHLDSIKVDAYDNDELLVVAFSNSFRTLDSFLKDIRRIQLKDLDIATPDVYDPDDLNQVWHVCASSHMSYGYHIDFSFSSPDETTFLKWDRDNDCKEGDTDLIYEINCLIETKPGHRNAFCNYLANSAKVAFGVDGFYLNKTVTGGSIVHIRIPLEKVQVLHEMAKGDFLNEKTDSIGVFRRDVRRIKLTLNDNRKPSNQSVVENHRCACVKENLINQNTISSIKDRLTHLGISKIVRERLLSLLDVYNDCGRDKLQSFYFLQLKPAVRNVLSILKDFDENINESLLDIEIKLNEEISALETAFYNRMNNKMSPNTILEYGGGVQQFLQAFGFAYKEIVRVTSPSEAAKNYSLITGVCKEASMRTHTELNINHILYPQLFCVTTWKEASNFTIQLLDGYADAKRENEDWKLYQEEKVLFDIFNKLIHNKAAMDSIIEQMLSQTDFVRTDPVYGVLYELFTPECLKYSLLDYILYHFTFNRDYGLMWRFYMKVFLQTPSVYRRRGEVKRNAFYFELLRLFLVAFREKDPDLRNEITTFIESQRSIPFDHALSALWFECFDKIEKAARNLCKNLQSYAYYEVSNAVIRHSEFSLIDISENSDTYTEYLMQSLVGATTSEEILKRIREARKKNIKNCVDQIEKYRYLDINSFASKCQFSPDNTISLLNAFLIVIDHLDQEGKDNIVVNSLPRDTTGEIDFNLVKKMASSSSNLLADPIGGFVIPDPLIRKKYNAYRTLLYRTLWDMSYVSSAFIYDYPGEN